MLNSTPLLVTYDMTVNSKCDSWIRVPQLPLNKGWSSAVRQQRTRHTKPHRMEPTDGNLHETETFLQPMSLRDAHADQAA